VVEGGNCARLFEQALFIRFSAVEVFREELERDNAMEFEIACLQDYAHAAGADASEDFVVAQEVSCTWQTGHRATDSMGNCMGRGDGGISS
jgi:hypothetical protein